MSEAGLIEYLSSNGLSAWVLQVAIVLGIAFVLYITQILSFKKLGEKFKKTKRSWDDALIYSLSKPLGILIWLVSIVFSLHIIQKSLLNLPILSLLLNIRNMAIAILVVWFLLRFIDGIKHNLLVVRPSGKQVDVTTVHAVCKFMQLGAIVVGILLAMQAMGIDISVLLAFGGGSAIVVGIAAQDLLANFFGGIVVLMDKPFKVGDWISSPDKQIEGTVEYIGWRQTRIRTFAKRPLYVPNSNFTNITIENPSRMLNRQMKKVVGVRYDDVHVVSQITKEITEMLRESDKIDTNMACFVNLIEFSASSLDILIYCFTKTTNWIEFQQIQEDLMLEIAGIIEKHGASIAFPTTTLDLPDNLFQAS